MVVGAAVSAPPTVSSAAEGDKSLVAIVRNEKVLDASNKVDAAILKKMLDDLVMAVTGESSGAAAWKKLVKPTDTVGLVSTPAMNKTHQELIDAVAEAVKAAGVPADKVISTRPKPPELATCTALISMPGLKAHALTGLGTVLKNYITYGPTPARSFTRKTAPNSPRSGTNRRSRARPG